MNYIYRFTNTNYAYKYKMIGINFWKKLFDVLKDTSMILRDDS